MKPCGAPLSVVCPKCGAGIGVQCWSKSTRRPRQPILYYHLARVTKAESLK